MYHKPLLVAAALSAGVVCLQASATVYNVNIGSQDLTGYQGAATENPVSGSVWNNALRDSNPPGGTGIVNAFTLEDSTGDNSAGVTFAVTADTASGSILGSGNGNGNNNDAIYTGWIKDDNNQNPWTITFGNLNPTLEYSVVYYAAWQFGPEAMDITQTAGTGLVSTFTLNTADTDVITTPLGQDTDPGNNPGNFGYARFDNLASTAGGDISFTVAGGDWPISGFQLVEVPEPSSLALLGLGGLFIARRRRS